MTQLAEKLVADNYHYAYKIAYMFKSHLMPDYVKEEIALNALYKAAEKFDPSRGVTFSSVLYRYVMNALGNKKACLKRLPVVVDESSSSSADYDSSNTVINLFDRVKAKEEPTSFDLDGYKKLRGSLDSKLTDRQKKLVEILYDQDSFLEDYIKEHNPRTKPVKVTFDLIGKVLGLSKARISQEVKVIRNVAREVLTKINTEEGFCGRAE